MPTPVDPLWLHGFPLLPVPRQVHVTGRFCPRLPEQVRCGDGVASDDVAVETLTAALRAAPATAAAGEPLQITLALDPGGLGEPIPGEVREQAYRLTLSPQRVEVVGAAAAGLLYGAQTLVHLLGCRPEGRLALPAGEILDYPRVPLRVVHLDTKHHQDRLEMILAMIRRWAAMKVNAVAWEIEDKFAYQRHPEIGAPGAFTAEQVRRVVAEALRHHVQIIPILQGPGHMAYVLKHPQHAHLREDPANNYMICPRKEESWRLIFDMYDEILDATEGCAYFFIGTDEPYFLGSGVECGCAARKQEVGASGIFCDFVNRAAEHVRKRGRTPLCWAEYPLEQKDLHKLPKDLIDGIAGGGRRDREARWQATDELGIRHLVYASSQGVRPLFPGYFYDERAGDDPAMGGRVRANLATYRRGLAWQGRVVGTFTAAWDDGGLHNETFWLGWAVGAAAGWNVEPLDPDRLAVRFVRQFYGPETGGLVEALRLLDRQARFWDTSWDMVAAFRGPAYMLQWHERRDHVLALPNVPELAVLDNRPFFARRYAEVLAQAARMRAENDRLLELLTDNIPRAARNVYNLEVLLAVAHVCRHNLDLLGALAKAERLLSDARDCNRRGEYPQAVGHLRAAADTVQQIVEDGRGAFELYRATYEKSCFPKGRSVDGRDFVHVMDDTKDHKGDRRADLTFLIEREERLDLPAWLARLTQLTADYAHSHGVASG
jgi:hypothetical protein